MTANSPGGGPKRKQRSVKSGTSSRLPKKSEAHSVVDAMSGKPSCSVCGITFGNGPCDCTLCKAFETSGLCEVCRVAKGKS